MNSYHPVLLADVLKDNEHDADVVRMLNETALGGTLTMGGGAAPLRTFTMPNLIHGELNIFLATKESNGTPYFTLRIFKGRAIKKAICYYRYPTEARRDAAMAEHIKSEDLRLAFKAERKAEKQNIVNGLKVGDILHYSWGYEQTNCDFFQVVEVLPKSVKIREIGSKMVEGGGGSSMSCHSVPVPDSFPANAPVMLKKLGDSTGVGMPHGYARLWDGKPKYESWYA